MNPLLIANGISRGHGPANFHHVGDGNALSHPAVAHVCADAGGGKGGVLLQGLAGRKGGEQLAGGHHIADVHVPVARYIPVHYGRIGLFLPIPCHQHFLSGSHIAVQHLYIAPKKPYAGAVKARLKSGDGSIPVDIHEKTVFPVYVVTSGAV